MIKQMIMIWVRMISTFWRTAPFQLVFIAILYILEAIMPLVSIYLLKLSTDTIIEIIQTGKRANIGFLLIILQTIAVIFSFTLSSIRNLLTFQIQYKLGFAYQQMLLSKAYKLPLVFFDVSESYNQLDRASNTYQRGISLYFTTFDIVKNTVTFGGYLGLLLTVHWMLPVGMLILTIPSLFIHIWIGKKKYNQMVDQSTTSRRVDYLSRLLKSREAAKELRIFGHFPYLLEKWNTLFMKNATEQFDLEKKSSYANIIVTFIRDLSSLLFIGILLWMAIQGHITFGEFMAFGSGIALSLSLINAISEGFGSLHTESLFMNDFYDFLSLEEDHHSASKEKHVNNSVITIENMSFHYPNHSRMVLNNVSFQIKPGEKLAIVGENGAGKSTLIKCLMGLYTPSKGNIYYDGVNLLEIDRTILRRKISAIFQDFVHYQLTAKENIGIGRPDEMNNLESIRMVAQKADVLDAIDSLKDGFETELGTAFLDGQDLSGGQWQKIGLSRALLKDAEMIILDEPTAALDPIAEAKLLHEFIELTKDKTAIFITHRLGSCKYVDRIIVLHEGSIIEEGSHDELMQKNNTYAAMFNSQAKWYVS